MNNDTSKGVICLRKMTKEELEIHLKGILKVFKPTGKNLHKDTEKKPLDNK